MIKFLMNPNWIDLSILPKGFQGKIYSLYCYPIKPQYAHIVEIRECNYYHLIAEVCFNSEGI